MAHKDFVVSADGHLLEPTDLFRPACPKHLRDRAVWEEDFEIEPLVEGGARVFRRLHTPGFEGWTVSRYRQTGGRTPEGDPDRILEDMDLDGVDVAGDAPEPVAVRRCTPTTTSCRWRTPASTTTTSSSGSRRTSPGSRPTAPDPPHRRRRRGRRDRAGRRRGVPGGPAAGHAAEAATSRATSTRCGRRPRPTAMHVFFHTQTGGVKVGDPESHDAKVVMENGRAGQPADDREGGGRSGWSRRRLQPDRPAAGHLRADRRRRARALPRPALRADRVQRPLAGVARRRRWTSAGSPAIGQDADWWLGDWDDTRPADDQPQHGAAVPPQREVAVPAACRASTCSASSTCRSRTIPWPSPAGTSPGCRRSCGATTTRTPRGRSAAAGSCSPSSSPASPPTSAGAWSAAPSAGCSGSTRRCARLSEHRFDGRVAVVTGAGRGIGRAYARLLADAGRPRRRQRPRRLDGGRRRRRRSRRRRSPPRSSPTAARRSPTPATWPRPQGAQALVDAARRAVRPPRRPGQQRRHHAVGRAARGRRGQPGEPPRRPRRPARSTPPAPRGRTWSDRATAAS